MEMKLVLASLLLCVLGAYATQVRRCSAEGPQINPDDYKIGDCVKPPCKLRKKTSISAEFKFIPEIMLLFARVADHDVQSLKNSVHANILGVPLPYIGVDETDACVSIFDAEGNNKVGCPLKAGQTYLYKNAFKVEDYYPRIKTDITWSLKDGASKNVLCFKTGVRIL